MTSLITFAVLFLVGLLFGSLNEANHFRRLKKQEAELAHIKVFNLKTPPETAEKGGILVSGNVVIAVDYFKVFIANLKRLIGGRLGTYQSLLLRARREAVLRMKREAAELGADEVYNVRIEFSSIGSQPQMGGGVELLAYGTAIKQSDNDPDLA